jgi:YOP proteins translocation protein K (YscK)
METTDHTDRQWATFRSQPAAYAHPRRIKAAFANTIDEGVASKLAAERRFWDRLSVVLCEAYRLSDDTDDAPPSESAHRLILASSADLATWARRFGAVYWARAIAGVIESKAVVALKEALSDETYVVALAHRDLAGPERALPAPEQFDAAIASAGLRCLAAWCSTQPAWISQRIRLKVPDGTEFDEVVAAPFDEAGPRIVERVIA